MEPFNDEQNASATLSRPDVYDDQTVLPSTPVAQRGRMSSALSMFAQSEKTPANPAEKRLALAALCVACVSVFLTSMDQTVVVTALPRIIVDPGINVPITQLDHAAWIISAYLLGFVIVMPLMGRVSDIFGRRRILLLCLAIFGVGSIFCALAPMLGQTVDISFLNNFGIDTSSPGLIWLVSARFVQAIGGGAVVPIAMAVVSDFYGQKRLALALGIIGAVTEAGGVVGPLYGALLVSTLGWTSIFSLNVPIVLVLMIGVVFFIPKNQRRHEGIDWLGATLLGIALTCLSLGLSQQGTDLGPSTLGSSAPQNNPFLLVLAIIFLVLFVLLGLLKSWRVLRFSLHKPHVALVREKRWPVVDLSLFKRLPFSAASLVSLIVGVGLIIAMADIPLYVNTVLSGVVAPADMPLVSGLALLRMTVMIPIGALLGGWLCSRLSCRIIGVVGLLFTALGFYFMSRWPISVDWTLITLSTMTAGFGFGLVIAPISTTALNAARSTQAGMGAAIVTALRMVGMILGLAALTAWGLAYFKQLAGQFRSLPFGAPPAQLQQWQHDYIIHVIQSAHTVYNAIFFATMVLILIGIVPALFLWGRKPVPTETLLELEPTLVPDLIQVTQPVQDNTDAVVAPLVLMTTAPLNDDPFPTEFAPVAPLVSTQQHGGRKSRRRLIFGLVGGLLTLLLIGTALLAGFAYNASHPDAHATIGPTATATPVAGVRMFELAVNNLALTSIFASQLGTQGSALSNIQASPMPNDGLVLTLDLTISVSGLHRVLPVEMDTTIGLDSQQNIALKVQHLKRDGLDAGPTSAASMQDALNQLLLTTVMPALHGQLKGAKLVAVHTSSTVACGNGVEMLTLLIAAQPVQGIAAQPIPSVLCYTQPVDLNKLLPG